MDREPIGKQPPRYAFLLNPYRDERLSKCPTCRHLTSLRKFALYIHVEGFGPLTLGKTCRYCCKCEMIMAHEIELNAEIGIAISRHAPAAVGRGYLVIGTVVRKVWQRGLKGEGQLLEDALEHVAEFKQRLVLEVKPGGWYPASS